MPLTLETSCEQTYLWFKVTSAKKGKEKAESIRKKARNSEKGLMKLVIFRF